MTADGKDYFNVKERHRHRQTAFGGQESLLESIKENADATVVGPHSTSSFTKDINAFLKAFKANGKDSKKVIKDFVSFMKNEYDIKIKVK